MTQFTDLGLAEPILRALSEEGYVQPTPIQSQTIPQLLAGRDVVGIAQTGTGKTAAFALPILHRLAQNRVGLERRTCRVLVLSPTRELSGQIVDSFKTYGRHLRISVALAIGGVSIRPQASKLSNGVDILVATPGRLLDLLASHAVQLHRVETFVLDEADRMLDMGFINDIRKIIAKLPAKRQSLFFSATMPREIEDLSRQMLHDPARVAVTPVATTAEKVDQRVVHVDRGGKLALLADVLRGEAVDRALVFTRTKHGADKVVRQLVQKGFSADAIHGNKSQNQRDRALAGFRAGRIKTLVATDIAARGIDVDGVSHVVNYDMPNVPESYVHRIGRTARAGAEGIAISFCDGEERAFLRDIERLIRMSIPATNVRGEPQSVEPQSQQPRSQQARPHQARPQHARPKNAKPSRSGRGGQSRKGHRNDRQGNDRQKTRDRQANSSYNGEIGTVAFMQPNN